MPPPPPLPSLYQSLYIDCISEGKKRMSSGQELQIHSQIIERKCYLRADTIVIDYKGDLSVQGCGVHV